MLWYRHSFEQMSLMIWTGIFRWAMWPMGLLFEYFFILPSLHNYSFFRCFSKPICSSMWCSVSFPDLYQIYWWWFHTSGNISLASSWSAFPHTLRDWTSGRHLYKFLKDYTTLFTWIACINCQLNFDEQFM